MSRKRIPSDTEIDALAKRFRALWTPGEPLRPWLRRHAKMLLKLVHGKWSWAAIAIALEKAGVKYQTEREWTASWLQSDFYRAKAPLKGYARRKTPAAQNSVAVITAEPAPLPATLSQEQGAGREEPGEPEFKFARFIDWDERRHGEGRQPQQQPKPPPAPSEHYAEIMEQLTGKKPPY